jgi:OOP family OmpA-OmpF porin
LAGFLAKLPPDLVGNPVHKLKSLHLIVLPVLAGTVLAAGLCLAAPQAQAQETSAEALALEDEISESSTKDRVRAGLFLGGNYLSNENELGNSFHADQVPESGFLLGLRGSYLVLDSIAPHSDYKPQLSAELESKFTFSSTEGGSGRASISTPILGWRANAVLDINPEKKLVPFALVGLGGETVFGENLFMTSPDTDFAAYLGGGARYKVGKKLDLRGDLRLGATASREDSLASLFELHVGVAYNFGSTRTIVVVVQKPDEPEEPVRVDSDRDGILDADDACPDLAEVLNGIDDKDGCPEVDSDHDGLLGSEDQCPAAAEDVDGTMDEDGCPDPDNDGDGRPDVIDQCPNKAENLNGFEDEDGCPDVIPEQVKRFTGKIEGIKFKTGSARILSRSKRTLNAAHKVLEANPSVRIEISGHTDNVGSETNNRSLSRKRADYVKWYLVDKGIAADRIETVGYGPDKPMESNDTARGRKMNRRIEFRLLPGAATVAPAPGVMPGTAPAPTLPPPAPTPAPTDASN